MSSEIKASFGVALAAELTVSGSAVAPSVRAPEVARVQTPRSAANPDINATFNSNLNGNPGCLGGTGWYYGFDGNEGANIELLPVVLHEMGHGLGFSTTTSGTTGNFNGGFPSVFDRYLLDNQLDVHGEIVKGLLG